MRPKNTNLEYEKVELGEFLLTKIAAVEYDEEHEFVYQQKKTVCPGIRFKFLVKGYEYPKYTRWMKFNLGARSNLYKIYVSKLIANATPNMDFELDVFAGKVIKTLWGENDNGYQFVELVKPAGELTVVEIFNAEPAEAEETFDEKPKAVKPKVEAPKAETPKSEKPKAGKPATKTLGTSKTPTKNKELEEFEQAGAPDDDLNFAELE